MMILAAVSGCAGNAANAASAHDAVPATMLHAPPGTGGVMPPPGDAEKAIRDQYAEAVRQNTAPAYRLFMSRYPDHPLARDAAKRIDSLVNSQR
ncbi:hypothetical protein [Sphingobium lactosutens]|uniref:hypothetical protein n=1 Tax=Sphingobium lactosutens TaxID=522773 RepID=UPI0012686D1F|nr:hypothetical protein [Sphingobium lactosutens]